ncbi:MAG: hypothetical protein ACUVQG_03815 [Thermogutta sp.]
MTPIDWGVFAALLSTALALILPWMMKVQAKLAVAFTKLQALDNRLAAIDGKLDQILEAEHRRAVNEAVWENRLQALEAHFEEELPS